MVIMLDSFIILITVRLLEKSIEPGARQLIPPSLDAIKMQANPPNLPKRFPLRQPNLNLQ
jgi:hypothetical protein